VTSYKKDIKTAAEGGRAGRMLTEDPLILLLLGVGLQPLPRKTAPKEIHQDEAEGLEVVAAGLLNAYMMIQSNKMDG